MKKFQGEDYTLNYDDLNDIEFDNLIDEDLKEIELFLDSYMVKKVDDEKIENTIDVLREYIPKQAEEGIAIKLKQSLIGNIKSIINLVQFNISLVSKSYWILSLVLILLGVIATKKFNFNIYSSAIIMSPIPILLGIFELIKGKEENVWELELSYKYSLKETLLCKIVIILIFSILISLIMTVTLYNTNCEISLLKMIKLSLIPMFVTSAISLVIVSLYRNSNSIGVCVAIWMIQAATIDEKTIENILTIDNLTIIFTLIVSIILTIYASKLFYKMSVNYTDYKNCDF
ncbi:hypothetical protein [Romboutsia lituseburensis]|uniref:ABC-2 family transporter protein n=1 Tax=Romboutsia lituseburensis DSM 797 TaxID=1121325 RepID=A0A1G9P613_9FIRM|nr:hypothetical protein [Romboutsia lituseburensis]CEH33255.1 Hypothetical protein RLITU_0648 [Romboutsia lituseburensis]SDL94169.1 hypothetical protein SAMN04515677_104227 [Romboutsia lituseburensis DSM 797]